jgi:hypothetical protein
VDEGSRTLSGHPARRCARRLFGCALAVLGVTGLPGGARADVQRFAIVIGNDRGAAGEQALRYAESDAGRVYEVLRDLGGFAPANMVLLTGEDARTAEDTIIAVNERVRSALALPGSQAMLFVYYSGHADAEALHLGQSELPARRLAQLVHGSAATFRLMVLDACRSGALTRRKGGKIVPASRLLSEDALPGSGLAVLAASAAHEDAQESEEIRGSFFTHAFVSGLMGAADQDGDGAVSLSEAYQYSYGATLRATSRTAYGTQHPSFRFDYGGQGAVILTRPEAYAAARAQLHFPPDVTFLVLRDGAEGTVVGEVGAFDRRRALSVRPGSYFVRGRGRNELFEGRFALAAGSSTHVDVSRLDRVAYARLVRKGAGGRPVSHAVSVGPWLRSALTNADGPCSGGYAGYAAELEHFGLRARAGACTSRFENARVAATTNEIDLELRFAHSWDLAPFALDVGLGVGAALFMQRFETRGRAPARDSLSPYALIGAGASYALGGGYALGLDVTGETHLLRFERVNGESGLGQSALRVSAVLGKAF